VRPVPPIKGHPGLARHMAQSLVNDEFDISVFQELPIDHGCNSPLTMLWPNAVQAGAWPGALVPIEVNVLQHPVPTPLRCYKLGQALRRAIESYPEDLSVVLVATGGLSHQVHGERAGFNNTPWDMQFLELFEKDPVRLTELTQAEYARLGGMEGAEVIMWLVVRGALSATVRKIHQTYYLPSMTGIATAIYENDAIDTSVDTGAKHRAHMGRQLAGAEALEGTYPFTLARSVKGYRLNKFLHAMVEPAHRERFLKDEAGAMRDAGLSPEECDMVRRRDWRALIRYGASFFMLEKLGAVVGISNLHIYAAMRGETLETFQKTRNAPGALYSVAGKEASNLGWDGAAQKASG